ncbi:Uncharacterised protein [Vibrio cholerae]|nr:Uncharacterised protein [Vibrio cholerae]
MCSGALSECPLILSAATSDAPKLSPSGVAIIVT